MNMVILKRMSKYYGYHNNGVGYQSGRCCYQLVAVKLIIRPGGVAMIIRPGGVAMVIRP